MNLNSKLIITGIGSVATTYHLTKAILDDKPDLVIQAGVGGGFDQSIPLGTVALISEDNFADLGVMENKQWNDLFDLDLAKPGDKPFDKGRLMNNHKQLDRFGLPLLKGVTINEITTDPSRINIIKEKYAPAVESMEGAALHFVCLLEGVPFIQLRSLSNYVGERNKSKWQMDLAIKNLNDKLEKLIEQLK